MIIYLVYFSALYVLLLFQVVSLSCLECIPDCFKNCKENALDSYHQTRLDGSSAEVSTLQRGGRPHSDIRPISSATKQGIVFYDEDLAGFGKCAGAVLGACFGRLLAKCVNCSKPTTAAEREDEIFTPRKSQYESLRDQLEPPTQ